MLISVLAAATGSFSSSEDAGEDLLQISGLVQLFALVIGILAVATEFRHGTITPSLLAVPDRTRLVLAKLITALIAGALLGFAASAVCAVITLPILSARDAGTGSDTTTIINLIVGNTAACALFAALGVGLGALIRNQVGAIIGALGYLFVVEPLLGVIPGFSDVVQKWFPGGASSEVAGTSGLDDPLGQLPAGLAAGRLRGGVHRRRDRDDPAPRRQRLSSRRRGGRRKPSWASAALTPTSPASAPSDTSPSTLSRRFARRCASLAPAAVWSPSASGTAPPGAWRAKRTPCAAVASPVDGDDADEHVLGEREPALGLARAARAAPRRRARRPSRPPPRAGTAS